MADEETRRDWEPIQTNATERTERLRVLGGWLYRSITNTGNVAIVFVPGKAGKGAEAEA